MNFMVLSVVLSALGGVAFYFFGQAGAMSANASILLSFQAIIAAAVLVRLNRGVPSLDWKSVDVDPVKNLLDRLEEVAKVYIVVVATTLISILMIISVLYLDQLEFKYKSLAINITSSAFGALLGLLISRMTYVVWLDYDIVRLQRAVILSAAESDEAKKQAKIAEEKLKSITGARVTPL